jgi:ABC-2 type transport system permease protein
VTAAIRSEWIKLRTARSNLVLLSLAILLPIGLTLLLALTVSASDVTRSDLFDITLAGATIGRFLVAVLGVLVIGQEFRHNTIRVTFTAEPRRLRVMLAKIVTVAITALVVGAMCVFASYALGKAIFSARDLHFDTPTGTQARSLAGTVILYILYALCGLGLGAIIRATAGAITLIIVWPIVVEPIVFALVDPIKKWLPFSAGDQLVNTGNGREEGLSPWAGGSLFAAFVLLVLVVGTVLVARRDA